MNYRHAFHAGNVGDVVKHAVLVQLLAHLRRKPKPFFVLDTHGGIGWYDLADGAAMRTGEAAGGIDRLLAPAAVDDPAAAALLQPYLQAVEACRAASGCGRAYPGSPWLIRHFLRPHDRLAVCELHPDDAALLRARFRADPQVAVHERDGYEAVKGMMPPSERRGLVLIDPPYERTDEHERAARALAQGARRFATGLFVIWYPIKERAAVWRLHDAVVGTGLRRVLVAELLLYGHEDRVRLNGCGLILVNPPWAVVQALPTLLGALHAVLAVDGGEATTAWLVPE